MCKYLGTYLPFFRLGTLPLSRYYGRGGCVPMYVYMYLMEFHGNIEFSLITRYLSKASRAEQSKVEQSRAEQSKAEQSKAIQSKQIDNSTGTYGR